MTYLVCPYCGHDEYTDIYDEDTEQDGHKCENCKEFFIEPMEDYEFDNQMRENIAESRWEEKTDR